MPRTSAFTTGAENAEASASPFITSSAGERKAPSHDPELQRDLGVTAKGVLCPSDAAGSSAMCTGQSADAHPASPSMWAGQAACEDHTCVITLRGLPARPSLATSASSPMVAPASPIGELASSAFPAARPPPPPPPGGSITPWSLPLPFSGGGSSPAPLLPVLPAPPQQPERGSGSLTSTPVQVNGQCNQGLHMYAM